MEIENFKLAQYLIGIAWLAYIIYDITLAGKSPPILGVSFAWLLTLSLIFKFSQKIQIESKLFRVLIIVELAFIAFVTYGISLDYISYLIKLNSIEARSGRICLALFQELLVTAFVGFMVSLPIAALLKSKLLWNTFLIALPITISSAIGLYSSTKLAGALIIFFQIPSIIFSIWQGSVWFKNYLTRRSSTVTALPPLDSY